jgi:D-arginine dehydrogenase
VPDRGNYDIDVDMLLQGYLCLARARGAVVAFRRRSQRIERSGGVRRVKTSAGAVFQAGVLVNAAGAWGDEVAGWPRLYDARRSWYCRPEARTRLMISPADATPTHVHDVQPEEIDIAITIERIAGAGHRGGAGGAGLGGAAQLHARWGVRIRRGGGGRRVLLVRRPGR